jgi:hypothetical protein
VPGPPPGEKLSLTPDQGQDSQRHDQDGDHQVGDRERHQEVVGHVLEAALPADRQADEDVAGGGADSQDQSRQGPPVVGGVVGFRSVLSRGVVNYDGGLVVDLFHFCKGGFLLRTGENRPH